MLCLFCAADFSADVTAQSVYKMPSFSGKTIDNKIIDSTYFKDKITFISFSISDVDLV
ncbi:MAG: hypothetical protein IPK10_18100 [Bacteroidetes bacterium]|nr:hypothetical protein [Bacteroidota bacterium]